MKKTYQKPDTIAVMVVLSNMIAESQFNMNMDGKDNVDADKLDSREYDVWDD